MTTALHLFLETLMTVNEIAPSCVSIVADNAQAEASPKRGLLVSKSRKRTELDSSVHKEKSRWSAIALPSRRTDTMIERSVSDSVLSRPKRATSPERETGSTNASWGDGDRNCRSMLLEQPRSKETSVRAERTRNRLYMISEAIDRCGLLSSSPDKRTKRTTTSMLRTKSLDSKLHIKNRIDLHMSASKNFQMTETPRNAAESAIKTDSLLQSLGMMAPSALKKKKSKLTSHVVKPNSFRNSTKSSTSSSREKALGNDLDGSVANLSDRKRQERRTRT
jgi:hypothetical protein